MVKGRLDTMLGVDAGSLRACVFLPCGFVPRGHGSRDMLGRRERKRERMMMMMLFDRFDG